MPIMLLLCLTTIAVLRKLCQPYMLAFNPKLMKGLMARQMPFSISLVRSLSREGLLLHSLISAPVNPYVI